MVLEILAVDTHSAALWTWLDLVSALLHMNKSLSIGLYAVAFGLILALEFHAHQVLFDIAMDFFEFGPTDAVAFLRTTFHAINAHLVNAF